ncbi:MAG: hypothetical protein CUN53_11905 [Phototrophicales bacterium]|nr:MAG: hypothetical protein CUN53_11905 [Phototrophicales bacterium]
MGCRQGFRDMAVIGIAALAALYLINPTAGILEFIPDNFPLMGNLDEAGATAILLAALAYFGVDLKSLFGSRDKPKRKDPNIIDLDAHYGAEEERRRRR